MVSLQQAERASQAIIGALVADAAGKPFTIFTEKLKLDQSFYSNPLCSGSRILLNN